MDRGCINGPTVLYICSACCRFVSDTFFFSNASSLFCFGFTLNAIGFILRLAFLGFDSLLLFTLGTICSILLLCFRFLLCGNTFTLCLLSLKL
ncbi:hypothetical protein ABK939_17220 [Citrobacter freundii]|uniref:hypothetical protein n=1 Tax=Citrobacter freundii TaxID=546 RepID=UPI0037551475